MAAVIVEVGMVKHACSDLDRRVEATLSTSECAATINPSEPTPGLDVSQNEWQEVIRSIVRSERQVEGRQNNVILPGVPVAMKLAEVTDLLVPTIPDLAGQVQGTHVKQLRMHSAIIPVWSKLN